MTLEEIEAAVNQLQEQQSLQTSALKAALEARWVGEDSVDAYVKALMGGTAETSPKIPLYPE